MYCIKVRNIFHLYNPDVNIIDLFKSSCGPYFCTIEEGDTNGTFLDHIKAEADKPDE